MDIVDTRVLIHAEVVQHWEREHRNAAAALRVHPDRIENYINSFRLKQTNGDILVARIEDFFCNGFGIEWSPTQATIFSAIMDAYCEHVYGREWMRRKASVMKHRGLKCIKTEILISMGRRHGKSFVGAAVAAAIFLLAPDTFVAIFSLTERQSRLFMEQVIAHIDFAFDSGEYVCREDYKEISGTKEMLVIQHPDGSIQRLGSFPGTSKVSGARRRGCGCRRRHIT